MQHYKDMALDRLSANGYNVAQFVSFDPYREQRYSRVLGSAPNTTFTSEAVAIESLLTRSPEAAVHIRSFCPSDSKSHPFITNVARTQDVISALGARQMEGLHTIVNEGVDLHSGQVSGVVFGDAMELAPNDSPRCVEKPGVAQFSRAIGTKIITMMYGAEPTIPNTPSARVEFGMYPTPRGYLQGKTIVWEIESGGNYPSSPNTTWPNRLSEFVGDKTFGLMMSEAYGLSVPHTKVFCSDPLLMPFTFGEPIDGSEKWLRTAPKHQLPGYFPTVHGLESSDPRGFLNKIDPNHSNIGSVIVQDGVQATFSGATITGKDGVITQGVKGFGDAYMVGTKAPEVLPMEVIDAVKQTNAVVAEKTGGAVSFEWAYDCGKVWILQLHQGGSRSTVSIIVPGEQNTSYKTFDVRLGLEALRIFITGLQPKEGITLMGSVGVTSHFGDILRSANIPSRIFAEKSEQR